MRELREWPLLALYDLAVVGSGFGGTLLALIAKRLGLSVVLIESGCHPRFAIGESSTPLANLLWEELTTQYDLPALAPLAKWGTWQEAYPHLTCGLKRGFSFFYHSMGQPLQTSSRHENQLLVAASPHDRIADVHWYRAEVDQFLVHEAEKAGVDFFDGVRLEEAEESRDFMSLAGSRQGKHFSLRAKFVVDASGPRGFLHQALQLGEGELPGFPQTQALYSHFTGVRRFAACGENDFRQAPYRIDDAAVHHIFEGGWIWVLRFNNGITSAGVAALDRQAEKLAFHEGAPAWERLLRALPSVKEQFAESQAVRPFVHAPRLAFRSGRVTGKRWALLPSAAGFVDPLLSSGFPLTLLGVARLAKLLQAPWGSLEFESLAANYAEQTDLELMACSRLIAALYGAMGSFTSFADLSLLYFAAASYSETARRLGKPYLAGGFLLHDHPVFGPASRQLLEQALALDRSSARLRKDILQAIAPINVAGLGEEDRHNWYPADATDLLGAARKLLSNRDEIHSLLSRSGFWEDRV